MINVSVIIPVYNAEEHLEQCLNSVLSQDVQTLEVICVDDGSTDGSPDILAGYAEQDSRVKVLTQKNQYAGAARNRGIEHAGGKYIAFLDADDYFLPGSLSFMYGLADENRLDFIKCGFHYLNASTGEKYKTLFSMNSSIGRLRSRQALCFEKLPERLLNVSDVPWNGLYRCEFLDKEHIRFNNLRCVNDHSFFIACLLKAKRLMVRSEPVVCYRVGQEGSLVRKRAKHFEDQLESYRIVRMLCSDVRQELSRAVLLQELTEVFSWYDRLKTEEGLEGRMSSFVNELNEEEVGKTFLQSFPYSGDYYRMRYNALPPKRPNAPVRALRCWREHGMRYTLARLSSGGEKRWSV